MINFPFSDLQKSLIYSPVSDSILISGESGCGKTTAALGRLDHLLRQGISAQEILILAPQRSLAIPYYKFFQSSQHPGNCQAEIMTFAGLVKRMITLFWPLISEDGGFTDPKKPPTFLTMETSQYFMGQIVKPLFAHGYFDDINIDRNRIFNQIIDNMNKAAVVGFGIDELCERLGDAVTNNPGQMTAYKQTQECAQLFRNFCLQNNLLDFSLQVELFIHHIWTSTTAQKYLKQSYAHLIYENIEEDVPATHDLIKDWLPVFSSALLINDSDGGYRSYLGADPVSAVELGKKCRNFFQFDQPFGSHSNLKELRTVISKSILGCKISKNSPNLKTQFSLIEANFYPEMFTLVGQQVNDIIQSNHIKPEDIVILVPYLSDVLSFSLSRELALHSIPSYTVRPSHALNEEAVTRCIFTFAKLAHDDWKLPCSPLDIRFSMMTVINELDIVRADLCVRTLFSGKKENGSVISFLTLNKEMQERITFEIGFKIDQIRQWLANYKKNSPLPLYAFISRLFGELLSQPDFSFHNDYDAASLVSRLIDSVNKFREVNLTTPDFNESKCGLDYIQAQQEGLIPALFFSPRFEISSEAVLISPAYTFLMTNRTVKYQFWLDIGSLGWWERLNQPLTHPYLLSRNWKKGEKWTDAHEFGTNQEALARLTRGLLRHCTDHLYLVSTNYNEQGREQFGPLYRAFQNILREISRTGKAENV